VAVQTSPPFLLRPSIAYHSLTGISGSVQETITKTAFLTTTRRVILVSQRRDGWEAIFGEDVQGIY
jgi:hypothetical protein